jgi:hypothetical protein
MGNIYIETDENFRVTKIHRMPFDPNNGMGYTREELEKKGFFVDEIPEPVHQVGRRSIAMYNPDTKSIYYECIGIPMSDKERVEQLENALNFLMRNALYGANPSPYGLRAMAIEVPETPMSVDVTEFHPKLNVHEEGAANYLAHQIISGKLEVEDCLNTFPQFAEHIKKTLKENGIQV